MEKSNKELAVEATVEYIKSWNAADRTSAAKTEDFIDALEAIYSTLCSFDTK